MRLPRNELQELLEQRNDIVENHIFCQVTEEDLAFVKSLNGSNDVVCELRLEDQQHVQDLVEQVYQKNAGMSLVIAIWERYISICLYKAMLESGHYQGADLYYTHEEVEHAYQALCQQPVRNLDFADLINAPDMSCFFEQYGILNQGVGDRKVNFHLVLPDNMNLLCQIGLNQYINHRGTGSTFFVYTPNRHLNCYHADYHFSSVMMSRDSENAPYQYRLTRRNQRK